MNAAAASAAASTDWFGVGLVLAIVGGFLLANSILFRHPRSLVEEHFGGASARVSSIREYVFHRLQVHLGFLFLLVGFGLQMYGYYHPPVPPGASPTFPTAWVGGILLAVVLLELLGWWGSHRLFRYHVRQHFLRHPPELEANPSLARELGELYGIPPVGDDTVQAYAARLRRTIGLPHVPRVSEPPRLAPGLLDTDDAEAREIV